MYGFKPQHARGKPVQNYADGGLVNPLAGVGEYWSNSNAEFEAQNPNLLQRGVRAINPVTGFGSAVGAMHDGASVGSARDMAIAAMQAVPVFGAMRAVAPAVKTVAGAAPAVLVPSVAKTAARGAKGAAAGVAVDEAQAQNFADGGIVHSIKGALGFRPRTPEELLAADAKSQARNQEAAAAVAERNRKAQPAPKQQSAISEYSGMSAMQRREKEQGLKDGGTVKPRGVKAGGMIRGKGTGTSDSIPRGFKPGTFIMPADSTKAIGPEVLENVAKVPTKVSNGEFAYTPQEVHAVGINTLRQMKDATHNPKDDGVYFANGGQVRDPNRPDIPVVGTRGPVMGGGGGGLSREAVAQAQRPQAPQAQQPAKYGVGALPANPVTNPGAIIADRERKAQGFAGGGEVRGFKPEPQRLAVGDVVKSRQELYDDWQSKKAPWYLPTPRGNMEERVAEEAYTAAVRDPRSLTNGATAGNDAAAPAAPTAPNPTDMRLAAGTQTTPIGGVAEPSAPTSTGVTRTGNSYTGPANIAGDISVNGQAPRGSVTTLPAGATPFAGSPAASAQGFSPSMQGISAQNMGAADNLAARGQMESMGRLMASGQIQAPGAGPSFIMQSNTGFRRDPRLVAPEDAARRTLRYAQGDDPASRERKAKFQTAQLEQQGLAQRNQATNDIAQKELALKTEAQGFTTRAAQQQEQQRNVLADPKATPEQRAMAQRSLAAMSVKTAADRMQTVALPDTTNEMGQVVRGGQALVRVLEDGTVQQVPIGAQAPAPQGGLPKVATPQDLAALKSGTRFVDSNGVERIKK